MLKTTRFFFVTAMLMLVLSMSLHVAVLFGVMRLWSALVFCSLFGWITAMICGVNYHTMPVFTGRDFPKPALIWHAWLCVWLALGNSAWFKHGVVGRDLVYYQHRDVAQSS